MNKLSTPIILASALALTACGGSGDSTSVTAVSYTGPTAAIILDDSNQDDVSATAVDVGSGLFDSDLPFVGGVEASSNPVEYNLFDISKQITFNILKERDIPSEQILTGAVLTEACTDGGSATISGAVDAFINDTIIPGESISITFNSCIEGGILFNGAVSLTINTLTGTIYDNLNPWEAGISLSYDQLSIDNGLLFVDGDITLTTGENATSYYDTVSGTSLYVASGADQALLTNYVLSLITDNTTFAETIDSDFTYAGTDIGGSITVETTAPFVTNSFDMYPNQGSGTVTGAGGAKIRLTAIDEDWVTIDWDFDGDTIYEGTQAYMWAAL